MTNNIVGNMVRAKRKELHLTQEQLAELIDSDVYYISRIETGKKLPGNKFLLALSNALGVPVDFFLGVESNIVLTQQISALEEKMLKLSKEDRELVLSMMDSLIDRLSAD